jgi:hypothetical protein
MRVAINSILAACALFSFSSGAYAYGPPDTGQTQCYGPVDPNTGNDPDIISCIGTGQDGEFLLNAPSYSPGNTGIVVDVNTGLMWQQQDDGVSRDKTAAASYCENLNLDGLTGWRVPEMREIFGIVDFSKSEPAINAIFTNTKSWCYWSREYTFPLNFQYGWLNSVNAAASCSSTVYVRCVRGETYDQVLKNNGNGTVTDYRTGLTWQQTALASYSWPEALSVCNNLTLGSDNDWRLPNFKEIQSLIDPTLVSTINPDYFPDYDSVTSVWTSTTFDLWPRYAFHFDLQAAEAGWGGKWDEDILHMYVRCVRGNGQSAVANLTVNASGAGQGRITSDPSGISYLKKNSSMSKTKTFTTTEPITVTATAIGGSTVSWGGTCTAAGGVVGGSETVSTCSVSSMPSSKTITVSFPQTYPMPPAMTTDVLNYYYTLNDAYTNASQFDIIGMQAITFNEDLNITRLMLLALEGGYDSAFETKSGYTTINGNLTIDAGWIGIERVICNKLTIGGDTNTMVTVSGVTIK